MTITGALPGHRWQNLMLDTGQPWDYMLWRDEIHADVAAWQRAAAEPWHYRAPELGSIFGDAAGGRQLDVFGKGDQNLPVFPGSGGWTGHWAFAPYGLCASFDPPQVSATD